MLRIFWIILLTPFFVISQEQVSDIYDKVNIHPTGLYGKLGFALIAGQQYMIKDNDELSVYILRDSFELLWQGFDLEFESRVAQYRDVERNRSGLIIRDGKYYRMRSDVIQVIDIVSGKLEYELTEKDLGFSVSSVLSVTSDFIVASGYIKESRETILFSVDILSKSVKRHDKVPRDQYFDRDHSLLVNNMIYYFIDESGESDQLISYDFRTGEEIIFPRLLNEELFSVMHRAEGSRIIISTKSGNIYEINDNGFYEKLNCNIKGDLPILKTQMASEKLFVIYGERNQNISGSSIIEKVIMYDMETCKGREVWKFLQTSVSRVISRFFISTNELNNQDFTIIGLKGSTYTDNSFSILNHLDNTETLVPENPYDFSNDVRNVHEIVPYSPIRYKNWIICATKYYPDVSYSFDAFLIHDVNTKSTELIYPDKDKGNGSFSSMIGYFHNDELVVANNSRIETPAVWSMDDETNFTKLDSLDFGLNYGATIFDGGNYRVFNLSKNNDHFIFHAISGIYRTDLSGTERLFRIKPQIKFLKNLTSKVAYHSNENSEVFIINDSNGMSLHRRNLLDQKIESTLLDYSSYDLDFPYKIGSVILLDRKDYYNTKDNTIRTLDHGFYLSDYVEHSFDFDTFVYLNLAGRGIVSPVIFNGTENTSELLPFTFASSSKLKNTKSGNALILDNKSKRVSLVSKDETLIDIATDFQEASFKSISFEQSECNIIEIQDSLSSYLYVENKDQIDVVQGSYIYSDSDCHVLFAMNDVDVISYMYYEFGQKPILIYTGPVSEELRVLSINENHVLLYTHSGDIITKLIKYDFLTEKTEVVEGLTYNFSEYGYISGIHLEGDKYLVCKNTSLGNEPWILDINKGEFQLLSDMISGAHGSFPANFTYLDDFVYFTAFVEDGSRQWFRYKIDGATSVEQVTLNSPQQLVVYPNPTSGLLTLSSSYEEVNVCNLKGEIMLYTKDYNKSESIDVSSLPDGLYIIQATDSTGEVKTNKVVLSK